MDDEDVSEVTVGQRLLAAREEKGLSLEDVAAQTRIPRRHLESLEASDWERLPAPTYTIGFAKSYATAVGLERADIAERLRAEMGGTRAGPATTEIFEPADPARTMPKGLVFGAIAAILVLVLLMSWFNSRSLDGPQAEPEEAAAAPLGAPTTSAPQPAAPAQPTAQGPVVLTATAPAWVQVTDSGRTLFEGEMAPGQTFSVPQTATAPMLRVGAPQALRISVGTTVVPPVGPAGQVTSNVSLLAADLLRARPTTAAPAGASPTPSR